METINDVKVKYMALYDKNKDLESCVALLVHTLFNAGLEMSEDFEHAELIKEIIQKG